MTPVVYGVPPVAQASTLGNESDGNGAIALAYRTPTAASRASVDPGLATM